MTKERHPERNAEIRKLAAAGVPQKKIAEMYGMAQSSVNAVLHPERNTERYLRTYHAKFGIDEAFTQKRRDYARAYRARRRAAQSAGAAE